MKKFLLACALALPVLVLANHRASAWCNFNFSGGFNISFQHAWGCWGAGACPDANCLTDGCYPGYAGAYAPYGGYAPYGAYAVPADGQAVPAQPGQSFPPPPKAADDVKKSSYFGAWANGYQPVGYSYGFQSGQYAYPSTGYYQYPAGGSFQAPSYWYGR